MSLVKKPIMTEKKVAANRSNGGHSQGPATPEGRSACGAANCATAFMPRRRRPLCAVWARTRPTLRNCWKDSARNLRPGAPCRIELVNRLARVLWLVERADRSLEGDALRRASIADLGRDNRIHARMMRLKMTAETLRSLARSVGCWHYVTPREDLEVMKKLHQEGVAGEMGEIAMDLFDQLQEPGTDGDGVTENEKRVRVVNSMRSIFGLETIESPVAGADPRGRANGGHTRKVTKKPRGLPRVMRRVKIRKRMTGTPTLPRRTGTRGSGPASS